jgi:hypothetical protein
VVWDPIYVSQGNKLRKWKKMSDGCPFKTT